MTTQEPELGKLEWVDPRDAWKHEALDFTPWLATNLDRLAEVLGIELEFEDSEVYVGPYRADIVATDPRDDSRVLIENQLEDADLQHLGQLLAYLAGLEAKVVVWIAKDFDEQNLSAIRWLNDHTDDEYAFFAIRVRLARIRKSPLAPFFEVRQRPNNWDRQVRNAAQHGELSALGQFCREFWSHVAERHPGDVRPGYAGTYVHTNVEEAALRISRSVSYWCVGVCLTGNHNENDERALSRIEPYLKPLREATKSEHWVDDKWGESRLEIDTRDRNNWDRIADWLHERLEVYKRVLRDTEV